jgi:CelD/BcsL family acetyltransferase involved in cellulose biosynthesis
MTRTSPVSGPGERFEIIRDASGLAEIGPAWQELWERSGAPIFQSHAWIEAWWNTTPGQDRRQLVVATLWRGESLQGVMALSVRRDRGLRLLEWAGRDACDYCDALLEPGAPPAMLERLWAHVARNVRFDVCLLNRLLPGARVWALGEPASRARLGANRRLEHSHRVAGPWANGAEWFDHFPKKIRQNFKRGVKSLEEGAESLQFRLLPPDADLGPVLARLSTFKRMWLQKNGITAPLFDEGAPMLPALAEVLVRSGQMRMFVLERDGEIIALSLNFQQGRSLMAFVTAYDPAFERGSPGMVLLMDYIGWAFDNGLSEVDFLTGDEGFKNRFANEDVPLASLAGAGSLLGRLVLLADEAKERFHALRHPAPEEEAPLHPAGMAK